MRRISGTSFCTQKQQDIHRNSQVVLSDSPGTTHGVKRLLRAPHLVYPSVTCGLSLCHTRSMYLSPAVYSYVTRGLSNDQMQPICLSHVVYSSITCAPSACHTSSICLAHVVNHIWSIDLSHVVYPSVARGESICHKSSIHRAYVIYPPCV